ncbi:NAD(P)H-dependent flavin oxidoreductase [Thiohalomonas denitrificans]|uniref:NAD(P)H-dependent flavin oxidoreductase n=1 Tax=Thiohalomonas denitrificans TaxID=415747 RepID=UPI0026EAE74B|nr:nitronate monooxygenase family protein [Thiohalomonas denitrificans]
MFDIPFPLLKIREKELLPVIQGGMGVGVSAHRLAGTVAREGAVGTIASIDLRVHHPDLMERTRRVRDRNVIEEANLEALDREIRSAREISGPDGFIAVNVMKAVDRHQDLVRQACESGANAIIMGAGLPFDLPDMIKGYEDQVALIPILSEERGVRAVLKRWLRKGVVPDAIVLEHPAFAGGHLGAPKPENIKDPRFDFKRVLGEIPKVFEQLKLDAIPLLPAGGVNSFQKIKELLSFGASGVQIGTPFAVTEEGDAHDNFKKVLLEAKPDDIVTFMSTAGLPARAVLTPWLKKYLAREEKVRARATPEKGTCAVWFECLTHCGLKDGDGSSGQFCIDTQLQAAVQGNVDKGLFFRGSEPLPFGDQVRSVHDLLTYLLTGNDPRVLA